MSMSLKQYHKCQIRNNGPTMALHESQLRAEMGMSLKQYHKCQITNNEPTMDQI
jgi:hypothetical protein